MTLLFLGVVLSFYGALVLFGRGRDLYYPAYVSRLFRDAFTSGAVAEYGLWLLLAGGIALFGSFLLRDR